MTTYFSESIKDRGVKILQKLYSSLQFMLSKFRIDIFDVFVITRFFGNVVISVIFQQFFHYNFRLELKFWILMIPSERSSSNLSEFTLFQMENYFLINKNQFLGKRMKTFKLLLKVSNFINSDDCIGKIISKSIRLYPVYI